MLTLTLGNYRVRLAESLADLHATQQLRFLTFRKGRDGAIPAKGLDQDRFDEQCDHVMIEHLKTGQLLCSFRMLTFESGRETPMSYSAQFYDLSALHDFQGPMVEIGRFCIHPSAKDPDVLRVAWGALTKLVDAHGIELLFGCSSFQGTDAKPYSDAFAILRDRHLAPKRWLPKVKAPRVFDYAERVKRTIDRKSGMRLMPPLLKTYLLMGGWVSDHAVIDRQLNTMHLFTGVEINAIPPARKRLLRALVAAHA